MSEEKKERTRDYAFEALAEVTGSDWNAARGELNAGLTSIELQEPQLEPKSMALADEIHRRAVMYRDVMDGAILTPTALAKHWRRVQSETEEKEARARASRPATNRSAQVECQTCGGNRFVFVGTRPVVATAWMKENGFEPQGESEETAPCPDCNSGCEPSFRRNNGTMARVPDPAIVRQMMRS